MALSELEKSYITGLTMRGLNRTSALKEHLAQIEARERLREDLAWDERRVSRVLAWLALMFPVLAGNRTDMPIVGFPSSAMIMP